jgi:hypothetical protein
MRRAAPITLALALLAGAPGMAETARFSVRLAGFPVGEMVMAENSNGYTYAAQSAFRTTGLIGLLARVRYVMSARGAGRLPDVRSQHYTEDLDTGYRTSAIDLVFPGGDRRIDPLTGILAALTDRPADVGCAFNRRTWDGVRSMQVTIALVEQDKTEMICSGAATRVQGYTEKEMENAVSFPFTVRFEPRDGLMVAVRADIRTIHGPVALVRR